MSKLFDTVDHSIILKKLRLSGITEKTFNWFESCLSNGMQCIHIGENSKTDLKYITCGVSQGSIFETVLFLVYVKGLQMHLSYYIQSCLLMKLIFNHKDIKHLFTVVKKELVSIKYAFITNKLSLNNKKTKYSFFNKPSKKGNIHLCLPKLIINNYEIQRKESIKFLGVF